MSDQPYRPLETKRFYQLALAAVVIRLLLLPTPDLVDSTEGRYAAVAKLMLDRGDWLTPWIPMNGSIVPYLGKPPLHFWLVEACLKIFGKNEFATRMPSLFVGTLTALLVYILGAKISSPRTGAVAAAALMTSVLFFFLSGACVLDGTLTLSVTLSFVGFALGRDSKNWGLLFFLGCALGMLAKGPIAIALLFAALLPWLVVRWYTGATDWHTSITHLPWVPGCALFLAITAPWYLLQEQAHPGFLEYFLLHENLLRYVSHSYGDAYGSGHHQPPGMSWVMLAWAFFPWSFILLVMGLLGVRRQGVKTATATLLADPWTSYAVCWGLSCALFFTFAKQLTPTYVLPSLPGLALLSGLLFTRYESTLNERQKALCVGKWLGAAMGVVAIGAAIAGYNRGGIAGVTLACGIGGTLVLIVALRSKELTASSLSMTIGAGTLVACSAVVLSFAESVSANRSTQKLFRQVRSIRPKDPKISVGFPFYHPFSAYFYNTEFPRRAIVPIPLEIDQLRRAQVDLIAVRDKDEPKVRELLPAAELLASSGGWFIFSPPRRK